MHQYKMIEFFSRDGVFCALKFTHTVISSKGKKFSLFAFAGCNRDIINVKQDKAAIECIIFKDVSYICFITGFLPLLSPVYSKWQKTESFFRHLLEV